jgi:hypothetical protein
MRMRTAHTDSTSVMEWSTTTPRSVLPFFSWVMASTAYRARLKSRIMSRAARHAYKGSGTAAAAAQGPEGARSTSHPCCSGAGLILCPQGQSYISCPSMCRTQGLVVVYLAAAARFDAAAKDHRWCTQAAA